MWKKGKYVLFEMTFITSIGNAGDLHTLTILLVISSLSERELGRCVLLGHLCQQPLLCSIEKGRPGRFFQQVSFLLVCWYETQPLRSEIWRCVSNRHQKFIVFCTVVIFMWLIFKDWIPMAASQAGTLATKPKGPSRPWQDFAWNCLTQLPRQVGSCQTDGHLRTKGETPARTDQRRKSQRRQLLFKLFVASGAPSGAFVLKTQLETQARAAEQMDSSCSVCLHLPNELLPAPRRFPSALESRRSWRAGCLSGRRRDWDRFWGRLGVMLGDTRLWGLEGDLNLKPLHWTSGNPSKGAGIASRHYRVPPGVRVSLYLLQGEFVSSDCLVTLQLSPSLSLLISRGRGFYLPQKTASQTIMGSLCQHFDAKPGPAEGGFVISLIGPGLQFILAIN